MLTAGSIIKKERKEKNLSLEDISAATKIQKHYLEALENDEYSEFPSTVYAKGFLHNYSRYLGLDTDRIIALFRRSVDNEETAQVKQSKRPIKDIKFTFTPSTIILTSVVLLIVFTFSYLFYQFYNFQKPPKLEVTSPQNNETVESSEIKVEGKTENNMFVTINDEPIKINTDGSFSININLSEGQNTIILKAKHPDDIGKEAMITRNVEYKPVVVEESTEDIAGEEKEANITNEEMSVKIEITNESTWLEVKIDGKPEVTSIVLPGTTLEYKAKETVSITTGKVPSTRIFINDKEMAPYISDAGIGIIDCIQKDNEVNCQQP